MLEAKAEARQFKGLVEGYVEATVEGSSVQKKEGQEAKVTRQFWRLRATESKKMATVREDRLGLSSCLAPAKRHRPGGPTEDDLRTEVGYYQRVTVETFVTEEAEHTSKAMMPVGDRPRPTAVPPVKAMPAVPPVTSKAAMSVEDRPRPTDSRDYKDVKDEDDNEKNSSIAEDSPCCCCECSPCCCDLCSPCCCEYSPI